MKKWIIFGMMMLMCIAPVHADVLAMPLDDEFFREHMDECPDVQKYAMPSKEVKLYSAPNSNTVIGTWPANTELFLDFSYTDPETNEIWYIHEFVLDGENRYAWFKSDHLEILYGEFDFFDEYKEELVDDSTEMKIEASEGYVVLWMYPNSDQVEIFLDVWYAQTGGLKSTRTYVDEQNVTWYDVFCLDAHVSGWMNGQEMTVEVADPENYRHAVVYNRPEGAEEIVQPDETIVATPEPTVDPVAEVVEAESNHNTIIGALVIGVCVMTGILAKMFWKKK